MSDQQPEDSMPPVPRRSVEVAIARMEAKLDVAIAQHSVRLDDHDRRLAGLEQNRVADTARTAALEQARAADQAKDAAEAAARPAPMGAAAWAGLVISLLIGLYLILDHLPKGTLP